MNCKVNILLPCVTFFSAGRGAAGLLNLLMQATIVLWPLAYIWARHFNRADGVRRVLTDFSQTYEIPRSAHVRPSRRFRQADLSDVYGDEVSFGNLKVSKVSVA
jgi:hypothetical protein